MVWISSTDLLTLIQSLKKPEWNTVRGEQHNKTLEIVKNEIKKLEEQHKELGRRTEEENEVVASQSIN